MAIVEAYSSTNLVDPNSWFGDIVRATSTEIVISDGYRTAVYEGYGFSYIGYEVVGGTLTGYRDYYQGTLMNEAYNFALPAAAVSDYIDQNNLQGLFRTALNYDDVIYGSVYDDDLAGYDGYDVIYTGGGDDFVSGGYGIDTVVLRGYGNDYRLGTSGSDILIDRTDGTSYNTLNSVERIRFDNGTLAVDVAEGQNAGQAYRIYQAAFDRTPDAGGLRYWIDELDDGADLIDVASGFVGSAEFRSVYGYNPTDYEFVDRLYYNVLGRQGEDRGVDYWLDTLEDGASRAYVLAMFAESPENIVGTTPELSSGIWLG
ncbi:DUF4214 domain-containing protein [Pseudorhizobium flavum]|uniref:DUF4214 domain-containing protein n=1 Tax=Pseudorhizobium flavum TaxID=1335061 RepID=A0A7X0DGD2_9HYPH|nr:DUF4214 domain-containing protein [Pseudorhizobium flavum]MBB6182059.1 hypothetical protein [Pseudorhizobium flavum]CAD6632132.1 hypothetical protein RFYW14_04612 [Pseudorhizobium flavum]